MTIQETLIARSGGVCELCGGTDGLEDCAVGPDADGSADMAACLCQTCREQIEGTPEPAARELTSAPREE